MKERIRYVALAGMFLFFSVSYAVSFETRDGKTLLSNLASKVIYNENGDVVFDGNGEKTNYSKEQIGNSRRSFPQEATDTSEVFSQDYFTANLAWAFAPFGSGIGESNIIAAKNGTYNEIYLGGSSSTFGANDYWQVLRYNAATGQYDQVYVSQFYTSPIKRIDLLNISGTSAAPKQSIVVIALENGDIELYNRATWSKMNGFRTAANELTGLELADVDKNGSIEFVITSIDHVYVYSYAGVLTWDMAVTEACDVVVGQMDGDSALEIAVTGGQVIDWGTKTVQWSWPDGFGRILKVSDIDEDGKQELIAAEAWYFVWAYDVDRKLPKWSLSTSHDIGAIFVRDVDNDGIKELLVGDGQWGELHAYNTLTQVEEWAIDNPMHGVTSISVTDSNGDGKLEILWGAGATDTGPDHLYIADIGTRAIIWESPDLGGPFVGPARGDLDGDGIPELVVAAWDSDAGYGSGRILVFTREGQLRAISDQIVGGAAITGTHDLKLRDIDKDGRMEILIATDDLYDGVIEIYDFDAANLFTLKWTNTTRPSGAPFHAVDAADIDNDGAIEIIAGAGREHTGATGVFIYVYDYTTRNEEWHSMQMGSYWSSITAVAVADFDSDGVKEIAGLVDQGGVYIYNGKSKLLDAIISGTYTAMKPRWPSILLGDTGGNIALYNYSNGAYNESWNRHYVSGQIDGFTFGPNSTLWIGSEGNLSTSAETSQAILWQSPNYSPVFGKSTVFFCGREMFVSAGSLGVRGFHGACADWGK